jgi:hypothetical protein
MTDGLVNSSTENLLIIRENLWNGLAIIGQHYIDGTAQTAKGEKDCTPEMFGACLTAPLFFKVNEILVERGEEDYTGRLS